MDPTLAFLLGCLLWPCVCPCCIALSTIPLPILIIQSMTTDFDESTKSNQNNSPSKQTKECPCIDSSSCQTINPPTSAHQIACNHSCANTVMKNYMHGCYRASKKLTDYLKDMSEHYSCKNLKGDKSNPECNNQDLKTEECSELCPSDQGPLPDCVQPTVKAEECNTKEESPKDQGPLPDCIELTVTAEECNTKEESPKDQGPLPDCIKLTVTADECNTKKESPKDQEAHPDCVQSTVNAEECNKIIGCPKDQGALPDCMDTTVKAEQCNTKKECHEDQGAFPDCKNCIESIVKAEECNTKEASVTQPSAEEQGPCPLPKECIKSKCCGKCAKNSLKSCCCLKKKISKSLSDAKSELTKKDSKYCPETCGCKV